MKLISRETCDIERGYYGSVDTHFDHVSITGPQDGESAFKECSKILVTNCKLNLRYPFWHNTETVIEKCRFTKKARAPLWYDKNVLIKNTVCKGVKAVRECSDIVIKDSDFDSIEFGWKTKNIDVVDSKINAVYAFLESKNVYLNKVQFSGKYSFQYVVGLHIKNSVLNTKDAFWHSKDVLVEDSEVIGEYLAWYADGITFRNCIIKGTQPLCYAKNIKFENCTFVDCDLAFEYSEVNGTINGTFKSIKNPLKGHILIDEIPEMIVDDFNKSAGDFLIEKK